MFVGFSLFLLAFVLFTCVRAARVLEHKVTLDGHSQWLAPVFHVRESCLGAVAPAPKAADLNLF